MAKAQVIRVGYGVTPASVYSQVLGSSFVLISILGKVRVTSQRGCYKVVYTSKGGSIYTYKCYSLLNAVRVAMAYIVK